MVTLILEKHIEVGYIEKTKINISIADIGFNYVLCPDI